MRFRTPSLLIQFTVMGGGIMLVAMTLAGLYASNGISGKAIESTAASTALFLDSLLDPHVQELANRDILGPENTAALNNLFSMDKFVARFPHVDIWKEGGVVAYSRTPELIGGSFAPPPGLLTALEGEITALYTDLNAGEHIAREFDEKFLEIYVPIREDSSGRIIAVAEIHEVTSHLETTISHVRTQSWLAVSGATLLIMCGLFAVVYRGSRIIASQQTVLRDRLAEVKSVSELNRMLKEKSQRASSRLSELNESYLRSIGAELHDGPAQLLGLASLKIEHVRRARTAARREVQLRELESALSDALSDIRTLSKGLMLPEIKHLPLCDVVERVSKIHERRTGTSVLVRCGEVGPLSHATKICVYRFVQEGLNNAFRHAGGIGQVVECMQNGPVLQVSVHDSGGTAATGFPDIEAGLGLTGLRERVESLGGGLTVRKDRDAGTVISMNVPTEEEYLECTCGRGDRG